MKYKVKVPKWGLTIETVTIGEWFVSPGDTVSAGQTLCMVETDKTNSDIEAPVSGEIVELVVQPGDECAVGSTIAVIEAKGSPER